MATSISALQGHLSAVGAASRYCADGLLPPQLPGLTVEGIGDIGIPVPAETAQRLIAVAEQAPYGRGEETIVDTSVRQVWQLDPAQFRLGNPAWDDFVGRIVGEVKEALGIDRAVKAHLYKLLIYDEGSFFRAHRDSEKEAGMFGTLVISLPSRHEGGALLVRHEGQERRIAFDGDAGAFQIGYAAFYADCEHEVEPVTKGYRVCLVYNLALARGKQVPAAPRNAERAATLAGLLPAVLDEAEIDRLIIPLAHQYSQTSLEPEQLKGVDRSVFDLLQRAAKAAHFDLHLALFEIHQTGAAEDDYGYDFRRRRRSRWDFDDDEDPEEESEDIDVEMTEVYEERWTLRHWVDASGRARDFGEMDVEAEEVLEDPKAGRQFTQVVHGPTGNEGTTVERWYRNAAFVLWPKALRFRMLASQGQAHTVPLLKEVLELDNSRGPGAPATSLAREIILAWRTGWYPEARQAAEMAGEMLDCLLRIGDLELAQAFVEGPLQKDCPATAGGPLRRLCEHFGWATFEDALLAYMAGQHAGNHVDLAQLARLLDALCRDATSADPAQIPTETSADPARLSTCRRLATAFEAVIAGWDAQEVKGWGNAPAVTKRKGLLAPLFRALTSIDEGPRLEALFGRALVNPDRYDLHDVLIPSAREILAMHPPVAAGRKAAAMLADHCVRSLEDRCAPPLLPPADWRRPAALGCNCPDCQIVSAFLDDPEKSVLCFPLAQARRGHIHQQVDRNRCDLLHVTERKGRPYTLVLTKTRASYERALQQRDLDTKLLAELRGRSESALE